MTVIKSTISMSGNVAGISSTIVPGAPQANLDTLILNNTNHGFREAARAVFTAPRAKVQVSMAEEKKRRKEAREQAAAAR